eukprot:scaffold11928_cov111-Isochrysis_galbana.AAC.4
MLVRLQASNLRRRTEGAGEGEGMSGCGRAIWERADWLGLNMREHQAAVWHLKQHRRHFVGRSPARGELAGLGLPVQEVAGHGQHFLLHRAHINLPQHPAFSPDKEEHTVERSLPLLHDSHAPVKMPFRHHFRQSPEVLLLPVAERKDPAQQGASGPSGSPTARARAAAMGLPQSPQTYACGPSRYEPSAAPARRRSPRPLTRAC